MTVTDYFAYGCIPDTFVLVVTLNAAVILEAITRTAFMYIHHKSLS